MRGEADHPGRAQSIAAARGARPDTRPARRGEHDGDGKRDSRFAEFVAARNPNPARGTREM